MNKKGNLTDVVSWIEFCVGFFLVAGMILMFVSNFNANVQSINDSVIPSQVKTTSSDYSSWLPKGVDYLFLGIFIIFLGFSVFSARLIPSTPAYIFIAIFGTIFLTFGAMIIENIWDGWLQQSALATVYNSMTFLPFIMNNLRYFVLFYSIAVSIALLSKDSGGEIK